MKLLLSIIEATAKHRPAGYYDDVVAHGTVEGTSLVLDDATFRQLCAKYRGSPMQQSSEAATLATERYAVCKTCDETLDNGHGCKLHAGCCFGAWRTDAANKCPKGKW